MDFVIVSANDEADIMRAVTINTARGLPSPKWGDSHGSISVCGNGPSLREDFPRRGPIAALNGAWKTLVARGVMPDYIIIHDPTPHNVAFVENAPDTTYLLASRVHPSVFEKLAGRNVILWHVLDEPEAKTGTKHLIGGGFSIGCHALNLLNLMGFKHFDCYGYDSSYALDGMHHTTLQHWNLTPPQPYQVGERMFVAEPWMAAQVQEFLRQIEANRFNYTVTMHGDGMLPAAVKHNTLEILYDLDVAPGSFDFFYAMANAENYRRQHGYSRAVVNFKAGSEHGFRPNELIHVEHSYKMQMLNRVVRPMLKMFAFEEVESVSNWHQFQYTPKESLEYFRATGQMAEFRESAEATLWAKQFSDHPHVITLREADHWPQRNSKLDEWIRFAKTLSGRVIFVRDTAKANELVPGFEICPEASLDIHKRLALYRKARMNYTVATGPAVFLHFSRDIPYLHFFTDAPGYHCYSKEWLREHTGLGDFYPWHDPEKQRLVWADDTFENIVAANRQFTEARGEAA